MPTILMVPGFTNSGPRHWQSFWEADNPEYRRVQQRDWDHPQPDDWIGALDEAIAAADDDVILVGHSLGCIAIAKWASGRRGARVAGALLVAPADVEAASAPEEVRGFAPIPLEPLPFRTVIVASDDDPLLTPARAEELASRWGARLVSIGSAGHINTAAGYGPWPEGKVLLEELIANAEKARS
jgi:predicted alpha/beta hydrolase family esterase